MFYYRKIVLPPKTVKRPAHHLLIRQLAQGVQTQGQMAGVGVESQDVVGATDKILRKLLQNPQVMNGERPARIIIDSEYFYNESSNVVNKNLFTDRLRVSLNSAANGRIVFVGRHYSDMVEKERQLKRDGVVDSGTLRQRKQTAGADFRLGGRIASLDAMRADQMSQRYTQITFELVDLEYGTIVWSDIVEFKKVAQDDIVYR